MSDKKATIAEVKKMFGKRFLVGLKLAEVEIGLRKVQ
jgi:hypothetical protein